MSEKSSKISFAGMAVGAVALLLALVHFWAGPFSTQPTLEETVAETSVAIRDATLAALKGEDPVPKSKQNSMDLDRMVSVATAVLSGLAIILAVVGFANKEPARVAGGAAVLGGTALVFQFAVVALGVIFVAILIAAVLSLIGVG